MKTTSERVVYVVMRWADGKVLYDDTGLTLAATRYNPGTVCGRGRTRREARADAERLAEEARSVMAGSTAE